MRHKERQPHIGSINVIVGSKYSGHVYFKYNGDKPVERRSCTNFSSEPIRQS